MSRLFPLNLQRDFHDEIRHQKLEQNMQVCGTHVFPVIPKKAYVTSERRCDGRLLFAALLRDRISYSSQELMNCLSAGCVCGSQRIPARCRSCGPSFAPLILMTPESSFTSLRTVFLFRPHIRESSAIL